MIRFLKDSDKKQLKFFYDESYGTKHILNNPVHHNWQFQNNPFNKLPTKSILISESSSIIEAQLGFIPVDLKLFEEFYNSSWHISFFTLEKFRGQGLGTQLIEYGNDFFDFEELLSFENSLQHLILTNLHKAVKLHPNISLEDYKNSIFNEALIKLEELDHQYIADIYDTIYQVPEFLRLITKKDTTNCINQLLKRDSNKPLYTFTCRCRIDPPNDDRRKTKWHQEVFYTIPQSEFLQTWAPLVDDVNSHNGTMQVCVGSHKEGIAKQSWDKEVGGANPFTVDENLVKKYKILDVEMKKGQFMIFNSRLFHRSGINSSNKVRYSLVGMYHNVDNPYFEPPFLTFNYRKNPKQFYDDVFTLQKNN